MDVKTVKVQVKSEIIQGRIAINQRLNSFYFTVHKIGDSPVRISAFFDEK